MAQIFSVVFFGLATVAAVAMVVIMLRGEWARIAHILGGHELADARFIVPRVRVRLRSWNREEARRVPMPQRAAA